MNIYHCTKFQSNIPILSKDIARKPFFKVENFSVEKGRNSQNNWWILPEIERPTFYDYIPVYKISIQYTNPFKRYRTETKSVTYGTDGTGRDGTDVRTYGQRWYYMPPPPPPIENSGGITKKPYKIISWIQIEDKWPNCLIYKICTNKSKSMAHHRISPRQRHRISLRTSKFQMRSSSPHP